MGRKKLAVTIISALTAVLIGVGATLAVLSAISGPVTAIFVIGDIDLVLEETTGTDYKLLPGTKVTKDPRVTVKGGSTDCWLFVKLTKTGDAVGYLDYAVADGWTSLDGYDGVYYRSVSDVTEDTSFSVIKDDTVAVKDTITKETLQAITNRPKLTVSAYAVQSYGVDTALSAWNIILTEE